MVSSPAVTTLLVALQVAVVASRPFHPGLWCESTLVSFLSPRANSVADIKEFCSKLTSTVESHRTESADFKTLDLYQWEHPDFLGPASDEILAKRSDKPPAKQFWELPDVIRRPKSNNWPTRHLTKRQATLAGFESANLKSSFISPAWLRLKPGRPCSGELSGFKRPERGFLHRSWLMVQQKAHRLLVQTNSLPDNLAVACAAAVFIVVMILLSVEQYSRGKKAEARRASSPARIDIESIKVALTDALQNEDHLCMSPVTEKLLSDEKDFFEIDNDRNE